MVLPFNLTVDRGNKANRRGGTGEGGSSEADEMNSSKRIQKVRFLEKITQCGKQREEEMVQIEQNLFAEIKTSDNISPHIDPNPVKSVKITPATRSTYPHPIRRSYLRDEDLKALTGEQKLEILCDDGRHYHINFTRRKTSIVLHFPHRNKRFDLITNDQSITEYFLAFRGVYSIDDDGRDAVVDISSRSPDPRKTTSTLAESPKMAIIETPKKETNFPRERSRKRKTEPESELKKKIPPKRIIISDESDSDHKDSIEEQRTPQEIGENDAISPQHLPIGWVGQAIRLVCLDPSSLNPAAQKYTTLTRNLSRAELNITTHQRRIHAIDTEIDLLKSSETNHVQIASISSLSSSRNATSSPSRTGKLLLQFHEFDEMNPMRSGRQTTASHHSSSNMNLTRLLEEKITRLEKVELIRNEQRVLLHHKEATLRYLAGNAMDLMRPHVDEEIEKFLLDREENDR
jgi:hypothetical protein